MEQEDTGILKELVIGIRKQLSERLVSPLMPSFTISWLLVNYRLIVAILSDEPLESKLSFIDTVLYPTSQYVFVHGFLIPLAFALAYILAYPYPAKWVYKVALKRQHELREARQQAENARVLTLEESQRLRTYYYDREIDLQKQIQGQQEGMEQLRAKIAELEKSHRPVEVPVGLDGRYRQTSITIDLKDMTEDKLRVLRELSNVEKQGDREYMPERDLQKGVAYNITDLRIILEELERGNFIQKFTSNRGNEYKLNYEGRKVLVEKDKEVNDQPATEALAAQKEGYNSVSTEVSEQTNDSNNLSAKQQLSKSLPTGLSQYTSSPVKIKEYIKNEAMKVPVIELNEENIRSRFYGHEVDWDLNIDSIEMQENNSAIVTGSPEEPSIVSVKALVNLKQNPDVKLLTKNSMAKFVGTISSITGISTITLQDAKIYALNDK